MESSTLDLICRNRDSALETVAAEIAEFATVTPVGRTMRGSTCGGQGKWAIVWPASALTTTQRKRLKAMGWRYRSVGLGDAGGGVIGWAKSYS